MKAEADVSLAGYLDVNPSSIHDACVFAVRESRPIRMGVQASNSLEAKMPIPWMLHSLTAGTPILNGKAIPDSGNASVMAAKWVDIEVANEARICLTF